VPAPDLVRREFAAPVPDLLWLADITYVKTDEGFLYLAFVLDAHSRRLVGWSMVERLRTELVVDALEMALWRREPGAGLIHHTDRGSQYTALSFGKRLAEVGIRPTESALDNAMAESFVSTLKAELVDRHRFPTEKRRGWRYSSTSKDSTTGRGGTRRWAARVPSTTRRLQWRRLWWRSDRVSADVK